MKIGALKKGIFSIIAISLFLISLELLLRISGLDLKIDLFKLRLIENNPYIVPDMQTIWKYEPNSSFVYRDVLVHIDRNGFRVKSPDAPVDDQGYHVVFMGGSTTFGFGVTLEETFSSIIETQLKTRYGQASVHATNAGIVGYTSFQGLKLLETKILKMQPDLIVFSFTVNDQFLRNIPISELYSKLNSRTFKMKVLLSKSRIFCALSKMMASFLHPNSDLKMDTPGVRLDEYIQNLEKVHALCRANQIDLILMSEFSANENAMVPDEYQKTMEKFAQENRLCFINAQRVIQDKCKQDGLVNEDLQPVENVPTPEGPSKNSMRTLPERRRAKLKVKGEVVPAQFLKEYLWDYCHYTQKGHQVIAQPLYELISAFYEKRMVERIPKEQSINICE